MDILTLTTPIPRTLNLALNKLRDISTITTPHRADCPSLPKCENIPIGSFQDAIRHELDRDGQIGFLHNPSPAPIEGVADKIIHLVPEARVKVCWTRTTEFTRFGTAKGFRKERNITFSFRARLLKNGIDLPNANTMIVMECRTFWIVTALSTSWALVVENDKAFAYFLYQTPKLSVRSKKRLKQL